MYCVQSTAAYCRTTVLKMSSFVGRGHHARRGGHPEVIRGHCASRILGRGAGGCIMGDMGAGGPGRATWGPRWGAVPGVEGNGPGGRGFG